MGIWVNLKLNDVLITFITQLSQNKFHNINNKFKFRDTNLQFI